MLPPRQEGKPLCHSPLKNPQTPGPEYPPTHTFNDALQPFLDVATLSAPLALHHNSVSTEEQ